MIELTEFFDSLTTYLEADEMFCEFSEEYSLSMALKKTKSSLLRDYKDEQDMVILCKMSLYWLGLKKGYRFGELQQQLQAISQDEINGLFDISDALTIYDVLQKLLSEEPAPKPKRKVRTYGVTASWECGDLYAYKMSGQRAKEAGLDGYYLLIYVFHNEKTKLITIHFYCLLHSPEGMEKDPRTIIREGKFIRNSNSNIYRFQLIDDEGIFPEQNVTYIGNVQPIVTPEKEHIPPSTFFYRYTQWSDIEEEMLKKMEAYPN